MSAKITAPESAGPQRLDNFIDGRWVTGEGPAFESVSPHDAQLIVGSGQTASKHQVDAAIEAAKSAQRTWRRVPMHTRAVYLRRAAILLDRWAADAAATVARESGKPIGEVSGEIARAAEILRFHAGRADADAGQVFASPRAGERILVEHLPVGVVAVISPFNFPVAIPAWKVAPALIYGNAVVWKPPTSVAWSAGLLTQALAEAGLPRGVLAVVHGESEVGDQLTTHPGVDAVTFTGSTPVGQSIAGRCASRGVPVQAEMGGKNAAVVLADADLDVAVDAVVSGAFRSAGQKCTATSRLVLEESIAEEFLTRLRAAVENLTVGDPEDEKTYLGPLISAAARDRVDTAIQRAVDRDARVVHRRILSDELRGYYCGPAVLVIDGPDDELWTEELFGPVLAVLAAPDADTALALAGVGGFALSMSVFTRDLGSVLGAIDEVGAGMVHINSETAGADPHVPFGGNGLSGFGPREQGAAARDFYTTLTTIYLRGTER